MGGLIWECRQRLHEATELDERYARYGQRQSGGLSGSRECRCRQCRGYPASEQDDHINPAGVKGIGELGNVGTNAAICNAIFHATGQRIRKLPVRLEQLEI